MELGIIGLGKMGGGMARRLLRGGHRVRAFDLDPAAVADVVAAGAEGAADPEALVAALEPPRALWVMVPAGEATEGVLGRLAQLLAEGDVVVDGGNAHFEDSRRRGQELARRGIALLDAGTSGGVWGEEEGYCLMVGGEAEAVRRLAPAFDTLAPAGGWLRCGPAGAGHYVKMVHNAIEYTMMQAYAEGFELLAACETPLDPAAISRVWTRGSVIRSWLLELAARGLEENPGLEGLAARVDDSGEGRWAAMAAVERAVPTPALNAALATRFRSRRQSPYGERLLNLLRGAFGGHQVHRDGGDG